MCIIIDASLASAVFRSPPAPDFVPIFDWLLRRDGLLVYGGQQAVELSRVAAAASLLRTLQQAGRAKLVNTERVVVEEAQLMGQCQSNDRHVIALARVSGARTLCTNDQALMDDFKNRALVPTPRGRIYKNRRHARTTLIHTRGCAQPSSA